MLSVNIIDEHCSGLLLWRDEGVSEGAYRELAKRFSLCLKSVPFCF